MQKTVITFGLIAGLIIVVLWYATMPVWVKNGQMDFSSGLILGYINMIIALSMIFFGVRQYRERYLGGKITFGKAFTTGLLITLIASVIYVISWMIYYNVSDIGQSFPDQYIQHLKEGWENSGMSAEEVNKKTADMKVQMENYDNPIVMAGMTLFEIFPLGLIISLVSAIILKKK